MGLMSPLLAVLSILCGLALSLALFPLLTPWFLDSMMPAFGSSLLVSLYQFFLCLMYFAVLAFPVGAGVGLGIMMSRRYV